MVNAKAGAAMSGGAGDRHRVAPIPRQQCGQFGDLVIGDPGEHIGEPRLRIDTVELRRVNERQHDRGALAAAIRSDEQPGLSPKGNSAQHTLGCIVAHAPSSRPG